MILEDLIPLERFLAESPCPQPFRVGPKLAARTLKDGLAAAVYLPLGILLVVVVAFSLVELLMAIRGVGGISKSALFDSVLLSAV